MTGAGIGIGVGLLLVALSIGLVIRRVREDREFKARLRRMER